ncbi:MAG TPA: hypothetical protein DCE65_03535 [Clostridiales bacterium]|nr:hypothetical protein [Clostridiales bacterium]
MRKFSKITALILSVTAIFSVFASCKKDDDPKNNNEDVSAAVSRTQGIDFSSKIGEAKDYSVVISATATETEKYAAEQLIKYMSEVTGKEISYRADGVYSGGNAISVGRTEFMDSADITADRRELGSDGFIVKNKNTAVFICGGEDRGTLYGVYDFLEYQLGVKWLTSDTTYVPESENAAVYKSDRTEIPAFEYRVYLDPAAFFNDSTEFSTARRFTSEYLHLSDGAGGNLKWWQGYDTHNSLQWVKVEKYVKNGNIDPVYTKAFANDGENVVKETNLGNGTQYVADLCYTDGINDDGSFETETVNEDGTKRKTAIGMAIEGMTEVVKNDKDGNNYYMFGQNDYFSRPCLCKRCIADSKKYTDAGMMIRFINALSRGVQQFAREEGIERDLNVVMFAYQWSSYAPAEKTSDGNFRVIDSTCVPEDNVVIRLAPINMNRFASYGDKAQDDNPYGSDYMEKWAAVTDKFMVWEYTTHNPRHYWWYPTFPVWNGKLTAMKKMGVRYVMLQSNYQERTDYQTILEGYVASKILWNPDYDIYELISEFHRYYLGEEAREYADEYVRLMTSACYEALAKKDYRQSVGLAYCGKGTLKSAIALLNRAEDAVNASDLTDSEKAEYVRRIEVVKFQPRYMYLYNYMEYETDQVQMNIEAKRFILDAMSAGGMYWAENQLFDAENIIFK